MTQEALTAPCCHKEGSGCPMMSHRGLCQAIKGAPQEQIVLGTTVWQCLGRQQPRPLPYHQGWIPLTGTLQVFGEPLHWPVLVTWSATNSAMGLLNIFTMGELVAITMVVLQLILVTVMLRDKCLWRIRQNSEHPSTARGRLEGQSNVDRAQMSADMELPHGSSPRSSMSSSRRLPRFIRSCRDSQLLFEEHRKELEAQLAQWRWGRGSGRVVHTDLHGMPRLLGARECPQRLGVELARPDMNKVTEEVKHKNVRSCSGNSSTMLERRRSVVIAKLLPRLVVIMNPIVLESSSSSSSMELEYSTSTAAGRFLGQLHARLQRSLTAWQTRRVQRRWCFSIRFKSQWWRRCWTQLRKKV
ncbi:PREDICTED: uncharacterized protein LOC107603601 [Ficedula albicollis]|uniref:uncharacterized protein LOC107603601 n=1 Tax=Ficedula albicollis TaxID=59894 RepID=UPI0007AD94B2|nr:PREDICTED: uncharacterized protein LOC107603601 [Ficedula albicollis]